MKISRTCTAWLTTCTCLGLRFLSSGSSAGSSETSRRNRHPPCVVTSVESNATSASALGTGASASALMASSSSFGRLAAVSASPTGAQGASIRRRAVEETSAASVAGWPPTRIAARVEAARARSPASAASARSDASTTSFGTPARS
jgi:hypothetical protein